MVCFQARLLSAFTSAPSYNYAASNADFALVTLASPVGNETGWMGLMAGTDVVNLTTTGVRLTVSCLSAQPMQMQ